MVSAAVHECIFMQSFWLLWLKQSHFHTCFDPGRLLCFLLWHNGAFCFDTMIQSPKLLLIIIGHCFPSGYWLLMHFCSLLRFCSIATAQHHKHVMKLGQLHPCTKTNCNTRARFWFHSLWRFAFALNFVNSCCVVLCTCNCEGCGDLFFTGKKPYQNLHLDVNQCQIKAFKVLELDVLQPADAAAMADELITSLYSVEYKTLAASLWLLCCHRQQAAKQLNQKQNLVILNSLLLIARCLHS